MKRAFASVILAVSLLGCVTDEEEGEIGGSDETTAGEVSPQYRACPGGSNDECEDPTAFCFSQLGVCMKACAVTETCPEAPPEGGADPECALMEFDAQPFQVCLLSCGADHDCPQGMGCAPVPECQDCSGSICQPQ